MIKRFKKEIVRRYRIVKKFSSIFEARLAQEILNIYHIRTDIVRRYHSVCLLVIPQDYQFAYRVLYR